MQKNYDDTKNCNKLRRRKKSQQITTLQKITLTQKYRNKLCRRKITATNYDDTKKLRQITTTQKNCNRLRRRKKNCDKLRWHKKIATNYDSKKLQQKL